jgi:hypothetical protein
MPSLSFTAHPATVGETYGEHLRSALGFSFTMICGGLACLVHGVFPFLFTNTGSSKIRSLHERMIRNRSKVHRETLPGPIEPESAGTTQLG